MYCRSLITTAVQQQGLQRSYLIAQSLAVTQQLESNATAANAASPLINTWKCTNPVQEQCLQPSQQPTAIAGGKDIHA